MRRRALLRAAVLAAISIAAASCLSPTLPLPPPSVDDIQPSADMTKWTVSGSCFEGALVTVFNTKTGQGVVVQVPPASSQYSVVLHGTQCDLAWVEQQVDLEGNMPETSTQSGFVLAPVTGGATDSQACH